MPRRRFLALATLGGAVAPSIWPGNLTGAETPPKWSMQLSTSSILFQKLPIEQACERIAALGFEAIDIWSAHEGCPHLDDVAQRLGPDGLIQLLAKNRLRLYAFSVYQGGYAKYADLLGRAGGGVAIQGSAPACDPKDLKTRMRAFLEDLKPLADLATKNRSWLAIENHSHSLLDSLDSFKAFTDLNASPRLGIALAPYHLQSLRASVEQAIHICGTQLKFFYAWQNAPDQAQLPGLGPADFAPWLKALAQIHYSGCVNPFMHGLVEPDTLSQALARSRDYLQQAYRNMLL